MHRTPNRLAIALAVLTGLLVPAGSAWASFPGSNGKIVYAWLGEMAYRAGPTSSSIRTVDPRSGRVRVIRDCPLRTDEWRSLFTDCAVWAPRYSPNGRRIAFLSTRTVLDQSLQPPWRSSSGLATMASDGSAMDEHPTTPRYSALAWSPAGRQLLVERPLAVGGGSSIFLASLDGTELTQVTPGGTSMPDWSSTGEIAVTRTAQGPSCFPRCANIYVTRLGGRPRRLTYRGGENPSWSPHGTKLAFVRTERAGRSYESELYIVRREGGKPRHLTSGYDPTWSPDGRWIAFVDQGDLYMMPSAGGRARRILDTPPRGPHLSIDVPVVLSLDWQPRPLPKGKP